MIFFLIQAAVLAGVVCTAAMALFSKDFLISVILLGAMSLLLAVDFYILQAPDVAIAQAAIGAGLTMVIYVAAVSKTNRWEDEGKKH